MRTDNLEANIIGAAHAHVPGEMCINTSSGVSGGRQR